MALIGGALRQAFMPKREYDSLRDEDKAWGRLQKPCVAAFAAAVGLAVLVAALASLAIVFPADPARRPFCRSRTLQALPLDAIREPDADGGSHGAFYLTDEEVADYYWMVVFIPSAIVFLASAVYLLAGIIVAYYAPRRHFCLRVVENNYCASRRGPFILLGVLTALSINLFLRRVIKIWIFFKGYVLLGGVRCLSILNSVFAVVFGLMALLLGSSILTMGSNCSIALFWCYEIASWGLVILYGGTAFFLRRKAAVILDESDFAGRNLGLEMLESALEVTPEMERRVNEGFKSWMGSSLLSSDEEDGPDDYLEEGHPQLTNPDQQRE